MSRPGLQTRMERHDQTLTDKRHIRTTTTTPRSSGCFVADYDLTAETRGDFIIITEPAIGFFALYTAPLA